MIRINCLKARVDNISILGLRYGLAGPILHTLREFCPNSGFHEERLGLGLRGLSSLTIS